MCPKKETNNEVGLAVIDWLLKKGGSIDTSPINSFGDWKKIFDRDASVWPKTIETAVVGGFISDRVSYAFASGYESAIRHMVPDLPKGVIAAFCVTEEGGAHPKAIESTLKETDEVSGEKSWILNGSKKFITCANEAEMILAAASTGISPDGKNQIRIVLVDKNTPSISVEPMEQLPFVKEISHGRLHFKDVVVKGSQILDGDGYSDYIKPFRTIEDIHVFGAILGYLFRVASVFDWPKDIREGLLSMITTLRSLSLCDPLSREVHIVLGGLFRGLSELLYRADPHWDRVDKDTREGWERDRVLLSVAGRARERRLASAWEYYEE
jgi:hypothetical protein